MLYEARPTAEPREELWLVIAQEGVPYLTTMKLSGIGGLLEL